MYVLHTYIHTYYKCSCGVVKHTHTHTYVDCIYFTRHAVGGCLCVCTCAGFYIRHLLVCVRTHICPLGLCYTAVVCVHTLVLSDGTLHTTEMVVALNNQNVSCV